MASQLESKNALPGKQSPRCSWRVSRKQEIIFIVFVLLGAAYIKYALFRVDETSFAYVSGGLFSGEKVIERSGWHWRALGSNPPRYFSRRVQLHEVTVGALTKDFVEVKASVDITTRITPAELRALIKHAGSDKALIKVGLEPAIREMLSVYVSQRSAKELIEGTESLAAALPFQSGNSAERSDLPDDLAALPLEICSISLAELTLPRVFLDSQQRLLAARADAETYEFLSQIPFGAETGALASMFPSQSPGPLDSLATFASRHFLHVDHSLEARPRGDEAVE